MRNSRLSWLAAITIATLVGCKNTQKTPTPPLDIECQRSTTAELSDHIWFTTSTQAIYTAIIEPRIDGFLTWATAKSGVPVAKGELLYTIDSSQLITLYLESKAALSSAHATLIEARSNYERAKPMADLNAISRSTLDGYRASYDSALADLASAEESLRNARINLDYATITSPIAGLIANTTANVGDYVGPGSAYSTLTTINNIDTLQVSLAIPTNIYLRHAPSLNSYDNSQLLSDIRLTLPDSTLYPLAGSYAYTKQSGSADNSSIMVVVNFANPHGWLKSGMFARVRSNIGVARERVVVPQQSVVQFQGSSSVWVVSADSTVHNRLVEPGKVHGQMWEIVSGLAPGEIVATSGQLKLHEGMKIDPNITNK